MSSVYLTLKANHCSITHVSIKFHASVLLMPCAVLPPPPMPAQLTTLYMHIIFNYINLSIMKPLSKRVGQNKQLYSAHMHCLFNCLLLFIISNDIFCTKRKKKDTRKHNDVKNYHHMQSINTRE